MLTVVLIIRLCVRGNKRLLKGAGLSIALPLWPQYVFERLIKLCHALGQPRVRHPAPGICETPSGGLLGRRARIVSEDAQLCGVSISLETFPSVSPVHLEESDPGVRISLCLGWMSAGIERSPIAGETTWTHALYRLLCDTIDDLTQGILVSPREPVCFATTAQRLFTHVSPQTEGE